MKKLQVLLVALVAILSTLAVLAVGPRIKYHTLTWTPSTSPDVSGYWLYYRNPVGAYDDSARFPIGTNKTSVDLFLLPLPKGSYVFAMSATNAIGDESELSNEATWNSAVPVKPIITGILP